MFDNLSNYIQHNFAVLIYGLAFLSLFYYALIGKKINVPGPFFLLMGIGGVFMTYDQIKFNMPLYIILIRLFYTLVSFYLYFK